MRLFDYIPPDKIEWTYRPGKFTIGDLIRHLAGIERYMYAENVQLKPSRYQGCGAELAPGVDQTIAYYKRLHQESMTIFSQLPSAQIHRKCLTPGNVEITIWKWLRAMVEHEVHHRGQLYTYLSLLDVPAPPLYGLTSEEVIRRSEH